MRGRRAGIRRAVSPVCPSLRASAKGRGEVMGRAGSPGHCGEEGRGEGKRWRGEGRDRAGSPGHC
jgi:hypothetical protein